MCTYMSNASPLVAGFNVKEESIDTEEQEESKFDSSVKYIPSQTIDVYSKYLRDLSFVVSCCSS